MLHLGSLATAPSVAVPRVCGTQEAHDLRNLLAALGLHLETLQRLSGANGAKAADAAHAIVERAAALCDAALDSAAQPVHRSRHRRADLVQTACDVADLLAPGAPRNFSFNIDCNKSACVLADPEDAFRILFNLMHNAVTVAQRRKGCLTSLAIRTQTEGSMVTMKVADDGPGLPLDIRVRLFGTQPRRLSSTRHGYGLAIARKLAERNGGTLSVDSSHQGTTFALKLPSFARVTVREMA
jgi:signal transduction histidine kinase